MPLRLRVTIVTAIGSAIVLAMTGLFLVSRFEEGVRYTVEKALRSRAQAVVAAGADGIIGGEGRLIETDEAFMQILDTGGRVLETSAGIAPLPLASVGSLDGPLLVERDVRTIEEDTPLTPAMVLAVPAAERVVVVGASIEDELESIAAARRGLAVGGGGALLAITVIGWFVAGLALRPVERMRRDAEALTAGDGRLVIPATHDELTRLGVTLNSMIDRVRAASARERRFVDDAAHELRTPLSALRTEVDVALRRTRTAEELTRTLRSVLEETERLGRLAEDLLTLARADHGGAAVRAERVDIETIAAASATAHRQEAESAGVSIAVAGAASAEVDPDRIRQAMDNLLANALRHSPRGGTVDLEIHADGGEVCFQVTDDGPGFGTFLPEAFDAFARADPGRTRAHGGTGLGLAIVRAIARSHGGDATARDVEGRGARVVVTLPG